MEPCKIRGTAQPRLHAQGLEGKEISSPSGRGRKMSLTSPLIDPDFAENFVGPLVCFQEFSLRNRAFLIQAG
jgi:hypothetical protein